jgi:hypothetical protein
MVMVHEQPRHGGQELLSMRLVRAQFAGSTVGSAHLGRREASGSDEGATQGNLQVEFLTVPIHAGR